MLTLTVSRRTFFLSLLDIWRRISLPTRFVGLIPDRCFAYDEKMLAAFLARAQDSVADALLVGNTIQSAVPVFLTHKVLDVLHTLHHHPTNPLGLVPAIESISRAGLITMDYVANPSMREARRGHSMRHVRPTDVIHNLSSNSCYYHQYSIARALLYDGDPYISAAFDTIIRNRNSSFDRVALSYAKNIIHHRHNISPLDHMSSYIYTTDKTSMRVLFPCLPLTLSGAELNIIEISKELKKHRIESIFVVPESAQVEQKLKEKMISHIVWKHNFSKASHYSMCGVRDIINTYNIQTIYSNGRIGPGMTHVALHTSVPIVSHIRNINSIEDDMETLLFSEKIICSSRYIRKMTAKYGIMRGKTVLIRDGVFLPEIFEKRSRCSSTPARDKNINIVQVGWIGPEKCCALVLEAFCIFGKYVNDATLTYAGYVVQGCEGYLQEMRSAATKYGVVNRVQFLPWTDRIEKIFLDADVIVIANPRETFSRVVVEAMWFGVPVIVPRGSAASEILAAGAGLVFSPGDPEDLALKLAEILSTFTLDEVTSRRKAVSLSVARQTSRIARVFKEVAVSRGSMK